MEALARILVKVPRPEDVMAPPIAVVKKRLVEEAVVEKKDVVVAEVPVALMKVRFCNVDEALARRLVKVPSPEEVTAPPIAVVKKRLVELAVVEKRDVEVAEVVVALIPVKFCKVDEAVVKKPPVDSTRNRSLPAALRKRRKFPANEVVEEATIKSPVVEVALTWKYELLAMERVVVAPT